MSAFQWTALAFALIWITWKVLDRGVESFAILLQRFRHDGNRTVSAPDSNSPLVDVPSVSVGHPFAVDASNGSSDERWNADHTSGIRFLKSYDIHLDPQFLAEIDARFAAAEERRRLSGLTEIHRVNRLDPVVPPKSRPMRRTIH